MNAVRLNHPETIPPSQWKSCLPQTRSLVPKRFGGPLHGLCEAFQSPAKYTSMWTRPGLESWSHQMFLYWSELNKIQNPDPRWYFTTCQLLESRGGWSCLTGQPAEDSATLTGAPTGRHHWHVDHVEMSLHQLFRACWPLQPSLIKSMIVLLNKKPRVPIGFTMIFDKSFICPCFTVKRTVALLNCWLIKIPSTLAHLITHHRTMLHLLVGLSLSCWVNSFVQKLCHLTSLINWWHLRCSLISW